MIEIDKLSELNGADKYGSCASCGAGSKDSDNYRLSFSLEDSNQHSSITLCRSCMNKLCDMIENIDKGGK